MIAHIANCSGCTVARGYELAKTNARHIRGNKQLTDNYSRMQPSHSTKVSPLPVCFCCLVTLCQRLRFVSRFWRLISFHVCMYLHMQFMYRAAWYIRRQLMHAVRLSRHLDTWETPHGGLLLYAGICAALCRRSASDNTFLVSCLRKTVVCFILHM